MKTIVLSFDDGRLDTYENALPIMKKYNLTATINITTDFIENPSDYTCFLSSGNRAMTVEMIQDAFESGFEIASHGDHHKNESADINLSLIKLRQWLDIQNNYGFASPFSSLVGSNHPEIISMLEKGELAYIRSGIQIRRNGFWYKVAYLFEEVTHSKYLFFIMNRKLCKKKSGLYYQGVTINSNTTLNQVKYLIEHMDEDGEAILILHSVLKETDLGYGKDKWYIDTEMFDGMCQLLNSFHNVRVMTNMKLAEEKQNV